ncbi:MAG: response regulator [Bdellovibrionales bacterium]|nr:response regulator [Bdellovibrionales bacterium]
MHIEDAPASANNLAEARHRVLVFDDDGGFRTMVVTLLSRSGYEATEADTAESAAEALRSSSFDLIISDINAPGNEDLGFVKLVPELAPNTPVIIVTGFPSVDTAIDSIQLPVTAYMKKPFSNEELISNVKQAILRSRLLQNIKHTKQRMESWRENLNDIESLASLSHSSYASAVPIDAYITLTVQNIIDPLFDLVHLSQGLVQERSAPTANVCNLFQCPRVESHERMINQTIDVLEKTKQSFKSKTLADLRSRLEKYINP